MKTGVFYFGYSKGIGLTQHCCQQFLDLYKNAPEDITLYLISPDCEQNPGLWEKIRTQVRPEHILSFSKKQDLESLLPEIQKGITDYDKVVFHFHGVKSVISCRKLLQNKKIRSLLIINSYRNGTWKRNFYAVMFTYVILRWLTKAIFLSPFAWNHFAGTKLLMKKNKLLHIPFALPEEPAGDMISFPWEEQAFHIVYFASYFKNKGHEKFLPGMIDFVNKNKDARIHFFGSFNANAKKLKDKIANAGCEQQIICHDRIPHSEVLAILQKADTALMLSGSENAGHAGIEPFMNQVPVIGTRVGPLEYILQDGITGYGVASSEDLRCALQIMHDNPVLRQKMGETGFQIVKNLFDYQTMISAFLNLYMTI